MDPNNYPKGSILNPFTENEYNGMVQANTWYGGWIKNINDDIVYFTHGNDQHNYMGSKQQPYTNDIFTELSLNSMWIGGWVLHTDNSLRYYTASLTWHSPYHNDDLWGSEAYPVSSDIYVEMCNLSLWEGGWIESEDAIYYVGYPTLDGGSSGDGCGCGCSGEGSGCDEGSGCGEGGCDGGSGSDDQITPGETVIGQNNDGQLILHWDSKPNFTITVHFFDYTRYSYRLLKSLVSCLWDGRNTITMIGEVVYVSIEDETGYLFYDYIRVSNTSVTI